MQEFPWFFEVRGIKWNREINSQFLIKLTNLRDYGRSNQQHRAELQDAIRELNEMGSNINRSMGCSRFSSFKKWWDSEITKNVLVFEKIPWKIRKFTAFAKFQRKWSVWRKGSIVICRLADCVSLELLLLTVRTKWDKAIEHSEMREVKERWRK